MEADDDDCKYHLVWSSTAICPEPGAVLFTVKVTVKATGMPLTEAMPITDVSIASPPTLGDNSGLMMTEGPPGTYTVPIEFQSAGTWTVRFHFFGNCTDAPDAPHGHVAFYVTVP